MVKKVLLLFAALMLVVLTACGATTDKKSDGDGGSPSSKTLVLGTSADYPPYESVDTAKGKDVIGFDIDIANDIADQLGYKLKVENMDFNGLVPALNTKRVDFVMAGMTPTAKRKKSVDFSDIYYKAQQYIITRKDTGIKSIDDLKGKTVGVQLGAIQENIADDINKKVPIKIEKLNKVTELVEELKSNRIDAVVIEDAVAVGYLNGNDKLSAFAIPGKSPTGSAIAFPKDSKLVKQFNKELKKMVDNGKMDKLIEKWFTVKTN